MKIHSLSSLSLLLVAGASYANLDQYNPTDKLDFMPDFGVMQIFPDFPTFSGTVIDDFVTLGTVVRVRVAFELGDGGGIFATLPDRVEGWRISLWKTVDDAANSGLELDQRALATVFVPSKIGGQNNPNITYGRVNRNNTLQSPIFWVEITNLDLQTDPGLVWIGAAPKMPFAGNTQFFIQENTDPADRGGGGVKNARGVNPPGGFGVANPFLLNNDAAYQVESVPEPATLFALAAGLGALALRRRTRK